MKKTVEETRDKLALGDVRYYADEFNIGWMLTLHPIWSPKRRQAGAHLLHDVRYMNNGKTGSLMQFVICNEIIGWIKAYMKPLYINEQTLALDTIRDVVNQGGDFIRSDNTVKHFREDYYPRLLDRTNYETWEKGGSKSLTDRVVEYIEKLLSMPANERLAGDQLKAIQTIIEQ